MREIIWTLDTIKEGIERYYRRRKNIRHKLIKYADVPPSTQIYFVVDAPTLTDSDIQQSTQGSGALSKHPNINVILLQTFLSTVIARFSALPLPEGISLVLMETEQK